MSEHALSDPELPKRALSWLIWTGITALGAFALAGIALNRNEPVSAAWLVTAAICVYLISYRFYSKFIAEKVLQLDDTRMTPAERNNDGLDYVPTNRYVVFGHHFAAIAGAGPLVGPVLAAQMGYLPGTLWILVGVVFAGAVQDLTVLFLSMRRDGRSLGEMVKMEMGPAAGLVALIGVLLIMMILLAVLALVVVKALMGSPWGTFAVFCTIPIAILMGVYARFIRVGRIAEMSAIGVVLLLMALVYGRTVSEIPQLAAFFDLRGETLALFLIGLWLCRLGAADLAAAGAAGLSVDVSQDRNNGAAGDRHPGGSTRPQDAGCHPIHRRHRSGMVRQSVSVPFHHDRLRSGVRLPFADLIGHDAEDAREREPDTNDRLRRDVDGILRRDHDDDWRHSSRTRHLFCDEQSRRTDRLHRSQRSAGDFRLGLQRHTRPDQPDGPGCRREDPAVAHRRGADIGGGHGHHPFGDVWWANHDGHLVPLRDPVRGAVYSNHGRCRHPGRPFHDPGHGRQCDPLLQTHGIVVEQRHWLGYRGSSLGLFSLSGGHRSDGRDQHTVAALRNFQPNARWDRADHMHGSAVQDEARALCVGDHRADCMAARLHADCRPRKGVQLNTSDRLCQPCVEVQRRVVGRKNPCSSQDRRGNAACHRQRLCRCDTRRPVHRGRAGHGGLWGDRYLEGIEYPANHHRRSRRRRRRPGARTCLTFAPWVGGWPRPLA